MSAPDRGPVSRDEAERTRLRRISTALQSGGIAFLAVTSLGLLPTILSSSFPGLGPKAAVVVWIVAPAIPIALLVVAVFRLRR